MLIIKSIYCPVEIQVRTGPQYPCLSYYKVTEWGSPSYETAKTQTLCYRICSTIRTCSRAINAMHRPKFCNPSPLMVMSPNERNILKWRIPRNKQKGRAKVKVFVARFISALCKQNWWRLPMNAIFSCGIKNNKQSINQSSMVHVVSLYQS